MKILIAIDDSECSEAALQSITELWQKLAASLS